MDYISTGQAAVKWGITTNRITILAHEGRIPGAKQIGGRWMIPENAVKPVDGRTRAGKAAGNQAGSYRAAGNQDRRDHDGFRYPVFEHRDPADFDPPLSADELALKKIAEDAYACRFREAGELATELIERVCDRYCRIAALYYGCYMDMLLINGDRYLERYKRLVSEFQEDFPYKREMMEFLHVLDANISDNSYYARIFTVDSDYDYHESFLPRMANLCAVPLGTVGGDISATEFNAHKASCMMLEQSGYYSDAQSIHLSLAVAYAIMGKTKEMTCHMRSALHLAQNHKLYYPVALQCFYMKELFMPVLDEFPDEFGKMIIGLSDSIHRRYSLFIDEISSDSIYPLLCSRDYILVLYAAKGFSNKEAADLLNVSVGTVSKRYSKLYSEMGVKNKRQLVEMFRG